MRKGVDLLSMLQGGNYARASQQAIQANNIELRLEAAETEIYSQDLRLSSQEQRRYWRTARINQLLVRTANIANLAVTNAKINDASIDKLTAGTLTVEAAFGTGGVIKSGQTAYDTGTGFWIEHNTGTPRFSIGNSAANKLIWDGITLAVTGTITTTAGTIGGWTIDSTSIRNSASTVMLRGAGNLAFGTNFPYGWYWTLYR